MDQIGFSTLVQLPPETTDVHLHRIRVCFKLITPDALKNDLPTKRPAGVLCQRPLDLSSLGVTCIVVDDLRQALLDWAAATLGLYQPTVVAVTGSSGKTTTKEAVAAVLTSRFPVFKPPASYNGRYGLPIALGGLTPKHKIAVLELAADGFDEIRDLANLTRPLVGIVTTINEAHIAYFGSLDLIAQEKGRLIEALPENGLAILNADDARAAALEQRSRAPVILIGRSERATWRAGDISTDRDGTTFLLRHPGKTAGEVPVRLRLLGEHAIYPALAALAVGHTVYGISLEEAIAALESLSPLPGRLNPLPGQSGSLLLDDTISATPSSTLIALKTLAAFKQEQRVSVLGDMEALGEGEAEGYRRVGEAVARTTNHLITLGDRAREIAIAAEAAGLPTRNIFQTYSIAEAERHLIERLGPDTVALIKGSHDARLERLTARLLTPETVVNAERLLVRQGGSDSVTLLGFAPPDRPTWLEIDLDAISHNVRRVQEIIGPNVAIMAILKADGYGHGAAKVARTAVNNGAQMLGVACLAEAITLRRAGIEAPILVLGYTPAWQAKETLLYHVTATVFDLDSVHAFSRAASELRQTAHLHVKVDTGMGRLGLPPQDVLPFFRSLRDLHDIECEGIFTHFSTADSADKGYTYQQLTTFQDVLNRLKTEDLHPRLVHVANSSALFTLPESRFNMVRLGIALYGLAPSPDVPLPADFRRALTWKTTIAQVKSLPPGHPVSYGNTYRTTGEERIAVIPVGYADGFRRAPYHWGEVLVRGQRASIVGRVCMDQTMIDVTHIPGVRQGDEVVLIGGQGEDELQVEEIADRLGTFSYEVISEILARVPRVV